eukprot:TRINITY_DN3453_c0_g4_i2.p1 TRINITY_DN3453_c0_g4~~TRINITY_DN3453_c0_g4_i2.p1  ORF type:complete len:601 (-),score=57.72 TRINITY_DN3453_c0_g4_i2:2872-4674(-)
MYFVCNVSILLVSQEQSTHFEVCVCITYQCLPLYKGVTSKLAKIYFKFTWKYFTPVYACYSGTVRAVYYALFICVQTTLEKFQEYNLYYLTVYYFCCSGVYIFYSSMVFQHRSFTAKVFLLNLLVQFRSGLLTSQEQRQKQEESDNEVITIMGSAWAGNFDTLNNFSNQFVVYENTANSNQASSIASDARSGNSQFFEGGENGSINNGSIFGLYNYAQNNRAISQRQTAMSGQQSIFNQVQDSLVISRGNSTDNVAMVAGFMGAPDAAAISGIEMKARNVSKDLRDSLGSSLVTLSSTSQNEATNSFLGRAVAGVSNSIRQVRYSDSSFNNAADDNNAVAVNGKAISGTQNNVQSSHTAQLSFNSITTQNVATSEGGDAVAGIQNNVDIINGTEKLRFAPVLVENDFYVSGANFTFPSIQTSDTAVDNVAISRDDGKAIAGVQMSVGTSNDGLLRIDSYASGNRATTVGDGEGSQDAVAGVAVNLMTLNNSDVYIVAKTSDNLAFNYNQDPKYNSDAIAGVGIVIGSMQDSYLQVVSESQGNFAYASHGDAVAGNKIEIINDLGGNEFFIKDALNASNNIAFSASGNSIVDSKIITRKIP